jgi:PAS domain S-box-containing protein
MDSTLSGSRNITFDLAPLPMAVLDAGGRLAYLNSLFCQFLGYSAEELTNQPLSFYCIGPDADGIVNSLQAAESKPYPITLRARSGKPVFMLAHARRLSPFSQSDLVLALVRDEAAIGKRDPSADTALTDDLRQKERLLISVAQGIDLLLKAPDFLIALPEVLQLLGTVAGVDRVYLFENGTNAEGERITSQRFEWNSGAATPQIDNPDLQDLPFSEIASFIDAIQRHSVFHGLVKNMSRPLQQLLAAQEIISILILPIFVEESFWGFIGFDECKFERDWTEVERSILLSFAATLSGVILRSKTEKELVEARNEAIVANDAKSQFLAQMSHEIRTPLNGILGIIELAQMTRLSPTQRSYLEVAQNSANDLLDLINDILDFSKIEAGQMRIEQARFDVYDLVDKAVHILMGKIKESRIELFCDIDQSVPRRLIGDPLRFRQILMNLLSNAIKFTEKGEILVRLEAVDSVKEDQLSLRLSVSDTGIGIPQEMLEAIFESFRQVDNSNSKRFSGSGLGLSITRSLTEMMGGTVTVESEIGKGSTFIVVLPFQVAEDQDEEPSSLKWFFLKSILVVDDNKTNLRILEGMLKTEAKIVETCMDPRQVCTILQLAEEAERPFELLVLDYVMPHMDGIQLADKILHRGILVTPPVILLLSSADDPDVNIKARDLGIAACITKPVTLERLRHGLNGIREAAARPEEPEPPPAGREGGRQQSNAATILITEDNVVNLKISREYLRSAGYKIVEATNGLEAVACFQEQEIDLILMDVQMPEMDGYEASRRIRALEVGRDRRIPIVAITAFATAGYREKCLAAGMDDYLPKPFKREELLNLLSRYLDGVKKESKNQETLFDFQDMMRRISDDSALYDELVEDFGRSGYDHLKTARAALAEGDLETVRMQGHTMKGMSATLCAEPLRALSYQVETAAADQQGDQIADLLTQWECLFEATSAAMSAQKNHDRS